MTPDLLSECGRLLYGEQWQAPLARDLDINRRTIRRWLSADQTIPGRLAGELAQLARGRAVSLGGLAQKLEGV